MTGQELKDDTCKVVKRGFTAIGTKHETKYSDYPTAIPQAFETLTRRLEEIPNRSGVTLTLYEPKGDFVLDNLGTFYATAQVTDIGNIPQGMISQITPEHTYAV